MGARKFLSAAAACCAVVFVAAAPGRAEEPGALDSLSRATDRVDAGIALARDQINRGELPGAMATLERLMINHPDAVQAQLLHASVLCHLDDRIGASVEFAALRRAAFKDRDWKDATAPCAVDVDAKPGNTR